MPVRPERSEGCGAESGTIQTVASEAQQELFPGVWGQSPQRIAKWTATGNAAKDSYRQKGREYKHVAQASVSIQTTRLTRLRNVLVCPEFVGWALPTTIAPLVLAGSAHPTNLPASAGSPSAAGFSRWFAWPLPRSSLAGFSRLLDLCLRHAPAASAPARSQHGPPRGAPREAG